MCSEDMRDLFKKIPVHLPKPISHVENCQLLLNAFVGNWNMKKIM